MSDEYNVLMSIYQEIGRIADALEKVAKFMTPFPVVQYPEGYHGGEKSASKRETVFKEASQDVNAKQIVSTDSKPLPMTEEVLQDLTGVEPWAETDKGLMVIKNSYYKWIPKQYLVGDYEMGVTVDLKLSKGGAWVDKKVWKNCEELSL